MALTLGAALPTPKALTYNMHKCRRVSTAETVAGASSITRHRIGRQGAHHRQPSQALRGSSGRGRLVSVRRRPREARRGSRLCFAAAAGKDLYGVLGVNADASTKQIKQAYRQKAKKLHPDVNKAKDAQERFLECKMAYQVLSDPTTRAEYDRKRRGGGYAGAGSASSGGWGGFGMGDDFWRAAASGSGYKRGTRKEEEFYGFEDFFRDLDKELDEATKDGASLFSSLANDLVEFLEEGLKDLESELADVSDDFEAMAEDISRKYSKYTYDPKTGTGSWGTSGQSSKSATRGPPPPQSGSTDDDIDDTLAEMKKRMGL